MDVSQEGDDQVRSGGFIFGGLWRWMDVGGFYDWFGVVDADYAGVVVGAETELDSV